MLRTTSRAALAALAMSVALIATACMSNTTTPSPSAVAPTAAPASIAPTAAPPAPPNPTPAATATPAAIGPGSWTAAAFIPHGHSYGATATVLQDGRVLIAGGEGVSETATAAADLFDPATGRWTPTRKMFARRRGHIAVLLADGRVLVAGGWSYTQSRTDFGELFDPKTETWTKTSLMSHSRLDPKAVTLTDGRVLVAGGYSDCGCSTRRAEIYDPKTDTWTATRNMPTPAGSATLLGDGRVLVTSQEPSVETFLAFDPADGRWRTIANAPTDLRWGSAVRLTNGGVLFLDSQLAKGELYDPTANTWTAIDVPHTGDGPAVQLNDGTVLVVGKVSSARFDPATGAWSPVARPPVGRDYALDSIDGVEVDLMAELPDGRVFATSFGSTAIYDPTAGG